MRDKIRTYLKISVVLMTFLIISAYAYFEAGALINGPVITINYPLNGTTVNKKIIKILGTANNISFISLNGRPIFTDTEGNFSEQIILSKGYNSLFIKAEDRMGKERNKMIEIMLNDEVSSTTEENLAKK